MKQIRCGYKYCYTHFFIILSQVLLQLHASSLVTIHVASAAMRLVVQRVKSASVTVEGQGMVSQIGPGLVALVGIHEHDTLDDVRYCYRRLLGCKLWANDNGIQWRHSVKQRNLSCLLVSQFTLYGTLTKNKHQPDYKLAMKSIPAKKLYQEFLEMIRSEYDTDKIKDGVFGAMMDVSLVNDGPVTIIIESEPKAPEKAIEFLDESKKVEDDDDDNDDVPSML